MIYNQTVRYNRNRHYDPLIVDALVQRFPVPGATPADRCAAAKQLATKGYTHEKIALWLGCDARQVERMVHERIVAPLPEPIQIHEGPYPSCRNRHELSPDNVYARRRYGQPVTECVTCRRVNRTRRTTSDGCCTDELPI